MIRFPLQVGTDGVLRPLSSADAPLLAELANDKAIWLQVRDSMPHPYSLSDAHVFIDGQQDHPPVNLAIEHQGRFAGVIGVTAGKDVERHTAEVGYWVGAPFQHNGLATSALRAFIPYVFASFPFHRLHSFVFEGNVASMRVLLKCGFRPEGVLRKAALKDGHRRDIHLFGLLKEEIVR